MPSKPKRTLEEVLEAIDGSDGIKLTVATRLKVDRGTFDNYLERWATARDKFEEEKWNSLDLAKSVVMRNVTLAYNQQADADRPVDSTDAKWILAHLHPDFKTTQRTEIAGVEGQPLEINNFSLSDEQVERELAELIEIAAANEDYLSENEASSDPGAAQEG